MSSRIDRFIEIAKNSSTDMEIQRYVMRNMVTAEILNSMENLDISKTELASRLNFTKGHISRILSGDRNMTLDTISDIALALGVRFSFSTVFEKKGDVDCKCLDYLQISHNFSFTGDEEGEYLEYPNLGSSWNKKEPIKVA